MTNPLFGGFSRPAPNPVQNIIQQAYAFRNQFQGDAREQVQRLLNDGTMTQADFNRLMPIAQQIAAMMPRR